MQLKETASTLMRTLLYALVLLAPLMACALGVALSGCIPQVVLAESPAEPPEFPSVAAVTRSDTFGIQVTMATGDTVTMSLFEDGSIGVTDRPDTTEMVYFERWLEWTVNDDMGLADPCFPDPEPDYTLTPTTWMQQAAVRASLQHYAADWRSLYWLNGEAPAAGDVVSCFRLPVIW